MTADAGLTVIDYGVNNVGSVVNMLRRLGVASKVARAGDELASARAIVLPGIGSFDAGVQNLKARGLFDVIRSRVAEGTPILGICLGMQLLTEGSEEGKLEGLALLPAFTRRLTVDEPARIKIPHMGWNATECLDAELFGELGGSARFYYVHSYHVACTDPAHVAARCTYGRPFTAAVRRGHVMGTQFHPEKSHRYGLAVFRAFAGLTGADVA